MIGLNMLDAYAGNKLPWAAKNVLLQMGLKSKNVYACHISSKCISAP